MYNPNGYITFRLFKQIKIIVMEAKVTKKATREFLKNQLSTSEIWAKAALLKIYEYQTEEEKQIEHTTDHNGVGFTGVDGEILSSFAKQLQAKRYLSPKQMQILMKKMTKYWKQIMVISDQSKLNQLVANSLN